jgi:ubiquinone/menaquinone biosynthesis C-methylase UbiE
MGDLLQESNVSEAFSRQSFVFDNIYESNTTTLWMRQKVRNEILGQLKPGNRILELNCGTGIDTIFFARQGYKILATDNAEGMLNQLKEKVQSDALGNLVTTKKCSFNNINELNEGEFDYIFSNFGGLNCTDRLDKVLKDIDGLLKPGGYFTFVIMPVICPWELIMLFKGYFKTAFRRFNKKGTNAHLEGVYFKCYYYNPRYIINNVETGYVLCSLKGLASLVPPPFIEHFQEKHPKLFARLEKMENKLWERAPFNRWCDHYIITMQKSINKLP